MYSVQRFGSLVGVVAACGTVLSLHDSFAEAAEQAWKCDADPVFAADLLHLAVRSGRVA